MSCSFLSIMKTILHKFCTRPTIFQHFFILIQCKKGIQDSLLLKHDFLHAGRGTELTHIFQAA